MLKLYSCRRFGFQNCWLFPVTQSRTWSLTAKTPQPARRECDSIDFRAATESYRAHMRMCAFCRRTQAVSGCVQRERSARRPMTHTRRSGTRALRPRSQPAESGRALAGRWPGAAAPLWPCVCQSQDAHSACTACTAAHRPLTREVRSGP